jgi:hypothetical protein
MEELTSGDPDEWLGRASGPAPPAAGPMATLDLTGDLAVPAPDGVSLDDPSVLDLPLPAGVPIGLGSRSGTAMTGPPRTTLASFVVTEADRLLGTAYLLTGDRDRAEELLRSALATAAVTWAHRAEPAAGVLRAMAREYNGPFWWRSRPADAGPLPGDVGAGLARLSRRHRAAVVLRYHQRLTEEETGAALGAPVGNVRSWISLALDVLGIDTRLDLRPEAGPGLSRGGLSTELAALAAPAALAADPPDQDRRHHEPGTEPTDDDGPDDTEPHDAEPHNAKPDDTEPDNTEPDNTEPDKAEPDKAEPDKAGPHIAELDDAVLDDALRLQDRLADVRSRVPSRLRRARRRRAGVRSAIAVAAVAVVAAGLAQAGPVSDPVLEDPATEAAPAELFDPRNQPSDPDRFLFRPELAGDPLLVGRIGDRGQRELTLRFTPSTTNLAFSVFCHSWRDEGLWLESTLNGNDLVQYPCDRTGRANGDEISRDDYPRKTGAGWADLGVRPGRESVLRLRLSSEGQARLDYWALISRARIGVGVYELSGPRVRSDEVVIKRQTEHDDVGYTLGGYKTAKITKSRRALTLTVPAGTAPALIEVGMPHTATSGFEPMRVTMDGIRVTGVQSGTFRFTLPSPGRHVITLRARPDDSGTMLVAWYESSYEPVP